MKSRTIFLSLFCTATLFFWQCATNPTEPESPGPNEIWFQGGSVNPKTRTVTQGTSVVWINMDTQTHSVDSGSFMNPTTDFNSPNLGNGGSFSHTFNSAGSFTYYCSIHQDRSAETGTVIVQ
ncbi:MAG TPA: plastocyanin/azurin family copper-binding protein [bacterium]